MRLSLYTLALTFALALSRPLDTISGNFGGNNVELSPQLEVPEPGGIDEGLLGRGEVTRSFPGILHDTLMGGNN